MNKMRDLLSKTLVVGIIVLFIGVGIQPAFAVTPDISDSEDDCNLCAKKVSKQHIDRIINLIDRIEKYDNQLSIISKYYPGLLEKYQELSEIYKIIKNKTKVLELRRPKIIRYILCETTALITIIILCITLYIAFYLDYIGGSGDAFFEYLGWPFFNACMTITFFVCEPFLSEE